MSNKYCGLNDEEVIISKEKFGSNVKEKEKKESLLKKILETISEPMFILLFLAASVYFIVGEYGDGFIMLVFIIGICIIEFLQEQRTDKAVEELNKLSSLDIRVIRNSEEIVIDSKEVVVGDIVLLKEGDKVPADGIILECQGLGIDESLLTGESLIVYKHSKKDEKNHYKKNYCYEGTTVMSGSAVIKITDIGVNTELGKIGQKLVSIKNDNTPLEKQVNRCVWILTIICAIFFVLVFIVNFINYSNLDFKGRIVESILSGITVAMAMIPEEIPVILTVFLCLGSLKLSKQNSLIRNNKTIETLSAMTVLCTDKTGTLTEDKMLVEKTYDYSLDNSLISYLACEKNPYDSMEIAIKDYYKEEVADYDLVYEYLFNNEDKMVGKVWNVSGSNLLCVKGAYENVLPLCNLDSETYELIINEIDKYAKKGYRVIAVAKCEKILEICKNIKDYNLSFCGLIALSAPIKSGVKESIRECLNAGIRVVMITGDNGDTAIGTFKKMGITDCDKYLTGEDIEKMSDSQLLQLVNDVNIYARVYPEHKMRIVNALQQNGEVVAMIGDGINDAPALKKADIGISMGKRGTNVSKEASDIILLDDNFNTIVNAIRDGRTIYSNIKKSISYIFIIHIPIALLSLLVPLLHLPNILLPVHIVLLELLLDPTSSIIFQRIESDKQCMKRKPRCKDESLISKSDIIKYTLQGLFIFFVVLSTYIYLLNHNYEVSFAGTISYSILLVSVILLAFNLKSDEMTLKNLFLSFKDKTVLFINSVIIILLVLFIYLPFSHNTFGTFNLNFINWILVIALSLLTVFPFDVLKIFKNIKSRY